VGAPLRRVQLSLIPWLAGSAIFSWLLASTFRLEFEVILVHMTIVSGLITLGLLWRRSFNVDDTVFRTIWLLAGMALVILDTWSWMAQKAYMHDRSIMVLTEYVADLSNLVDQIIPLHPVATFILLSGVLFLFAFAGWRTGSVISDVISKAAPSEVNAYRWSLVVTGMLFVFGLWTIKDMGRRYGEPLTDIISNYGGTERIADSYQSGYPIATSVSASADRFTRGQSTGAYPNVVVIVVDALRADHTPQYGYSRNTLPLLSERLSEYRPLQPSLAVSNCSASVCGIYALLTGRSWDQFDPSVPTLPDVLRTAGYQTRLIASGDFSRGYPKLGLFAGGLDSSFVDGWGMNGASTDDRFLPEVVSNLEYSEDAPLYLYLHLHSVHTAGVRFVTPKWLPEHGPVESAFTNFSGRLKKNISKAFDQPLAVNPEDDNRRTRDLNHYDNSILQADSVIVSILGELDRSGIMDDAIVVITADHGEALGDRGQYFHGTSLYQDQISIPVWMIDTSGPFDREVPFARQVDIAPTILSRLGIAAPQDWEGTSLVDSVTSRVSYHVTTRKPWIYSVIDFSDEGVYKLIENESGSQELYDLALDPPESVNRIADASYASRRAKLHRLLKQRFFDMQEDAAHSD